MADDKTKAPMYNGFSLSCSSWLISGMPNITAGVPHATGPAELVNPLNILSGWTFRFRLISLNKRMSMFCELELMEE